MTDQGELFNMSNNDGRVTITPRFDGADYVPERDDTRLTGQINRVYSAIKDGAWRTLDCIHGITGDPHASISAQLRHLRKKRFGSHDIQRRHVSDGLYEYRLGGKA